MPDKKVIFFLGLCLALGEPLGVCRGQADGMKTGIIKNKEANPRKLDIQPALCPRIKRINEQEFIYDGAKDRLNHIPVFQLLDPDAGKGNQYKAYAEMDGKNVLLLKEVRISYDYEDTAIIDYEGPHPITGKPHVVHEGNGGFYANIHYAVVPYEKAIPEMNRQTLLHLATGKLKEIGKEDLRPALRTHSLIPGPFLSKSKRIYDMCEWGDTAYQYPEQILEYDQMALWDWDYSVKNADHILLIVWEGDEEDWLIQQKLIDPFYLTDDLIGIFEIKKKETKEPLTLKNERNDFEITVQTGDLKAPPK
ncbi:MAG: hypothetical protein HYU99_01235 [Deltaproteobacteria bacterium]|nr:hypothetical protein [Deltaproteobacteria bacterium]